MNDTSQHKNCELEIALIKQRIELMEKDVQALDGELRQLRQEMKEGFDKVLAKFDTVKEEMQQAKFFGKGVWWVIGGIVAIAIAFKELLLSLFKTAA